jgi:hypothetical protein
MTPEERDRLRTVEVMQAEMRADVKEIKQDVSALRSAQVKAGGVIIGASFVAAAFGWLIAKGATFAQKIGIGAP